MRLDALRRDLLLLGGVLAHPAQQWRRWRDLALELFRDGGATIDTPPAEEHARIGASTVIQADGDVLVFVDEASLLDETPLETHRQRVAEWYERSRATVRQAAVVVRALALAVSGVVATAGGMVTGGVVGRLAGLAVFGTLLMVGGRLFGLVASTVLRRRIDRVLRRAGVVG